MASPAFQTKKNLRSNASNTPPSTVSFTLLDIQKLIADSERRMTALIKEKFEGLSEKVGALEKAITAVKAVQVQQETDIGRIKELLYKQQVQIEAFEERDRRCNLVFSNVPEEPCTFESVSHADDEPKLVALANAILPPEQRIGKDNIVSVSRIGRAGGRPRLIKVRLTDADCKTNILRSSRNLNSPAIRSSFGRVFINKDMSFLRRMEEKRLRENLKQVRSRQPDAEVKLRNGKLFLGSIVRDCVDFRNQLF